MINGEQVATKPSSSDKQPIEPILTAQGEITPAMGVEVKPNGEVILTPYPTEPNSSVTDENLVNCN